jgi:hypothetical protein
LPGLYYSSPLAPSFSAPDASFFNLLAILLVGIGVGAIYQGFLLTIAWIILLLALSALIFYARL